MKKQDLTFEEKQKLVQLLRSTLHLRTIAKQLKISYPLLTLILKGDRKDHYKAIEKCYKEIKPSIEELKSIINKEN